MKALVQPANRLPVRTRTEKISAIAKQKNSESEAIGVVQGSPGACSQASSGILGALKGKRQCFSIFYDVNMNTKSKTDSEISRVSFGEIP